MSQAAVALETAWPEGWLGWQEVAAALLQEGSGCWVVAAIQQEEVCFVWEVVASPLEAAGLLAERSHRM